MEIDEESIAACALNRMFGYRPQIGRRIIKAAGNAAKVFTLPGRELLERTGPCGGAISQICPKAFDEAEMELRSLRTEDRLFIPYFSEAYPPLLSECEDAPIGLYYKGRDAPESTLVTRDKIAIVGTRDISPSGTRWCRAITAAIAGAASGEQRPCIVSGLALGTDICAHRTALEHGAPTIAVMATGIDEVYPYRHGYDADRIASSPGSALITDYPPHTAPVAINFIRRNRIIAGMSRATILIESKAKGGGMITARLASSYGREVFALPGRLDDPRSAGCLQLVGEKIAEIFTSPEDLADRLGLKSGKKPVKSTEQKMRERYEGRLSEEDLIRTMKAMEIIEKEETPDIQFITSATGWPYSVAAVVLGRLEADGFICADILGRYTPS